MLQRLTVFFGWPHGRWQAGIGEIEDPTPVAQR
jgi:hypothetical protein